VDAAEEVLDPEALTIGFARRFATYKRANLLFRNLDRLAQILNNRQRPVQLIFAGKAHPKDDAGKEFIRQIVTLARREEFRRRLVFIEDYDVAVARYLVQGADVWLNTPLRPLEASGTSGMKALANGVLNLSVLDGWWDEAWRFPSESNEMVGWAIGRGERYDDVDYQNQVESDMLYDLLERDVVPTFYDRGSNDLPRRWIERMKASIGTLCHFFNTHRMVQEYTERFYLVAHANYQNLTADGAARARALAAWLNRVSREWAQIRVEVLSNGAPPDLKVGERIHVRAKVHLGALSPSDVAVELCLGRVDAGGDLAGGLASPMEPASRDDSGDWIFEAKAVACDQSGRHGFTVRVLPYHLDATSTILPGLIAWA
jgi:starch phosphorylase